MRICILTKGEPYGWTRHYIAAFRAGGHDVRVVGPNISADELRAFNLEHLDAAAHRTDIETELGPTVRLADVLPAEWRPDLIVAISMAGTPLCPIFAGLQCPRVYLSVDTWQSPRDYLDALQYDFTFAAQKSFVARLRAMGARNVSWLPLACNPSEHFPVDLAPRADVTFAGTVSLPIHQQRLELIERLKQEVRFIGKTALYGPALCALCCAGKLTFNHSAVNDVNMRIFEALAMGAVLLTNAQAAENGLTDLFKDGEHLIIYEDADDLIKQTLLYLDNDLSRQRISTTARLDVLARHTYQHRVEEIIATVAHRVPEWPGAALREASPTAEAMPAGLRTLAVFGAAIYDEHWAKGRAPELVVAGGLDPVDLVDPVDAVLLMDAERPAKAIARSAKLLKDGGAFVARITTKQLAMLDLPLEPTVLRAWLAPMGLVLQTATLEQENKRLILSARKRSKTLAQVVDDAFATLPANCQHVRDGIHTWREENVPDL